MEKVRDLSAGPRTPLTKERVLRAAVSLADEGGIESLSMRRLAQDLGVEAMSLYNHVANKQAILDGMVDAFVDEIDEPSSGADWKAAIRERAMSARQALLRNRWAQDLIMSRNDMTPTMMKYFDSLIGVLLDGGFSADLAHHASHTLGSRMFGFTQELFEAQDDDSSQQVTALIQQMSGPYPNIAQMLTAVEHDEDSGVGGMCDDQFEFEFALDLILDGLERVRVQESDAG